MKIADFGLSKRAEEVTRPSTHVGTPGYWPPEVKPETKAILAQSINVNIDYGYAGDMWTLGEITYRILTKSPVFPRDEDLADFVRGNISFPAVTKEGMTDMCEGFLQRIMKANPNERMSAQEAQEHDWMEELVVERLRRLSLDTIEYAQPDTHRSSC